MKKILISGIFLSLGMTHCVGPQPQPSATTKTGDVVIGLTGDVMLGRLVNEEISRKDYDYPWGDMKNLLKANDLNLINLETTLTRSENKVEKVFNFKADPEKVEVLKRGNIHVANIANNHILDFSVPGMKETIDVLDRASILHTGAGDNLLAAKKPVIIEEKGTKIGIIGYTDNEPGWLATTNKAGTNYIQVGDIQTIKKDIKDLRREVDFLILTIHWGPNMREVPSNDFQAFAHQIIDAGVDLLHGHSAHVVQGIEVYKKKLILYDTGDFIDDYMVGPRLRNDHTFLFQITINKNKLKTLRLIPALISNMQVNHAKGADLREMITRIKNLSKAFGTEFVEVGENLVLHF